MASIQPEALFTILRQSRIASYTWWSATTVLWYNTILTLPTEVTYIWSSSWSLPKILYLLIKYWSLVVLTVNAAVFSSIQQSILRCQIFTWFIVTVGGSLIFCVMVDIILGIRLYALYNRDKRVLWFLVFVNIAHLIIQIYVLVNVGRSVVKTTFLAPPGLPLLGCLSNSDLDLTVPTWIAVMTVSTIYFIMMMGKFFQSLIQARRAGVRIRMPPLMRAFVRDGTIYFLVIVVILIGGALDSFLASGPLLTLYIPWNIVVYVLAASGLVLNLRKAAYADEPQGETFLRGLETALVFSQAQTPASAGTRPLENLPLPITSQNVP